MCNQFTSRKIQLYGYRKTIHGLRPQTSMIKYVRKATDRKHKCYIYLRALSIVSLINNSAALLFLLVSKHRGKLKTQALNA